MTPSEQPIVDAIVMDEEPTEAALRDIAWAHHRSILILAIAVLGGSFVLGQGGDGRLKLPGVDVPLPTVCTMKRFTGLDCPGCGLTRCFVSMSRGEISQAFGYHPVGVAIFFVVVAQLPYRGLQLRRLARGKPEIRAGSPWGLPIVMLAAMFAQWLIAIGVSVWGRLGT